MVDTNPSIFFFFVFFIGNLWNNTWLISQRCSGSRLQDGGQDPVTEVHKTIHSNPRSPYEREVIIHWSTCSSGLCTYDSPLFCSLQRSNDIWKWWQIWPVRKITIRDTNLLLCEQEDILKTETWLIVTMKRCYSSKLKWVAN